MLIQTFLSVTVALLLLSATAGAACSGVARVCLRADSQPPSPYASTLVTLPTRPLRAASLAATLQVSYLHRPLEIIAASPDPFGRTVPLLTHWFVAYPQLAYAMSRHWAFGSRVPLTVSPTGGGLASYQSSDHRLFFGDPTLSVVFQGKAGLRWFIQQELTPPLGESGSFADEPAFTYAPSATVATGTDALEAALKLGLRLQPGGDHGELREGSAAEFGVGGSYRWQRTTLGIELTATPSLRKRLGSDAGRRVPADWLLNIGQNVGGMLLFLGVGSSIPLTRYAGSDELSAGPPGAQLRAQLGLRSEFDLAH